MNKNKIIKKILIIFILIIIGILAPKKVNADSSTGVTYTSKFYTWGTGSDSWELISSVTDEDTKTIASVSNSNYTSSPQYISFNTIDSEWYLLCCSQDMPLQGDDDLEADHYLGQRARYVVDSSGPTVANPAEAYQLSILTSTYDGLHGTNAQYAWWCTYIGTYYGESSVPASLFAKGTGFQSYICKMMGWTNSQDIYYYDVYGSQYKQYTIDGITVYAPDLESVLEDAVKFSGDIDLDGDKKTQDDGDEDDQVTVNYDSTDNAYKIGPFMLEYKEYYSYQNGGIKEYSYDYTNFDVTSWATSVYNAMGGSNSKLGSLSDFIGAMSSRFGSGTGNYEVDDKDATVYAGMIGTYLETNLGILVFGEDFWFEYIDNEGESSVTGLPADHAVFYLCIKYEEGLTSIENFCFDYEYMNAGGNVIDYTGQMAYCSTCGTYFDYSVLAYLNANSYEKWNDWLESIGNENSNLELHMDYDGNFYHGSCYHYERRKTGTYTVSGVYHSPSCPKYGSSASADENGDGYSCYNYTNTYDKYDYVKITSSSFTFIDVQSICTVTSATRWYTYKIICLSLDIPQYASVTINKTVYDKSGNIADVDDTFYFNIIIDNTTVVETVAVTTDGGTGTATSTKILLENGSADYTIEEVEKDGYTSDDSKSSGMQRKTGGRFFIYSNCLGSEYNR